MMSQTFLAILIPVVTVIISVIASVIVATMKNRTEMAKIYRELDNRFAGSLFDKRVETFPELYYLLSDYLKTLQYRKNNVENLIEFKQALDEWCSKHSIFFTHPTARIESILRDWLQVVLSKKENALNKKDWDTIFSLIEAFMLSMRSEIGNIDTDPLGRTIELKEEVRQYIREGIKDMQKQTERLINASDENDVAVVSK